MIPAIIAEKMKNGQILILSATAPETIEAVAQKNIVWKNQSEYPEYPVSALEESVHIVNEPTYPPSGTPYAKL